MSLTVDDPRHGTCGGYTNHKCRCDRCRAVWRDYCRTRNHITGRSRPMAVLRAEQAARPFIHGGEYGYSRGCRCELCTEAVRVARAARRHAEKPRSIGNFDHALIRRAEELATIRATVTGELAELVREQEKDERWGHRISTPWLVSLDAPDAYGRELYDTLEIAA